MFCFGKTNCTYTGVLPLFESQDIPKNLTVFSKVTPQDSF